MAKFTAVEWQSFSLKKDIEIIVKKLQDDRAIQLSLLGEIVLVISGAALTKIFTGIEESIYFWIILILLSVIPLAKWIIEIIKKNRPGSDRMPPRDFINAFDNEITYYVLISESYHTMLIDALEYNSNSANIKKIPKDTIHFYYIQTSYYFKKAIADLTPVYNIASDVLSLDADTIVIKRHIALPRYYNVRKLLMTIFKYLEDHKNIMDDLQDGELIIKLNKKYMENLDRIHRAVSLDIENQPKYEEI